MTVNSRFDIKVFVKSKEAQTALKSLAGTFTKLGAAISVIGGLMVKSAASFETAMRNVNSILQITDAQLKSLADRTREISTRLDVKDTAIGVANAMYDLASAGFDAETSLQVAAEASRAAAAGLTQTSVAVKGVSSLMNAYNQKTVRDSIKFNDQLFRVVEKGVIRFEDLSNNLGSVGAMASSLKIPFEQVGAAFITMTKAGINASESETAITNLLRSIAGASEDTREEAAALGIELGDTALRTEEGLVRVLKQLEEVTGGSLTEMMKFIPEARAAKAALTLAKNGVQDYQQALEDMNNAQGATTRALNQQTQTFDFAWAQMVATLQDLKIEFGDIIKDAVKPFIGYLRDLLSWLKNLDDETKQNIVRAGAFVAAIGSLAAIISGLIAVITPMLPMLASLGSSWVAILTTLQSITGVIGLVGGALVLIHNAVETAKESSNGFVQVLGEMLKYLDLIGAAKEAVNTIKAIWQASADAEESEKRRIKALETVNRLKQREGELLKQNKQLSAEENQELAENLATLSTYATSRQKQLREEAAMRGQISRDQIKALDEQRKKEEKDAAIRAKRAEEENAKKLAALEAQKKAEEEYQRYLEDLEKKALSTIEDIRDQNNQSFDSQIAYQERKLRENYANREATLKTALNNNLISEKQYNNAIVLMAQTTNQELAKLSLSRTELIKAANADIIADLRKQSADYNKKQSTQTDIVELITGLSSDPTEQEKARTDLNKQIDGIKSDFQQKLQTLIDFKLDENKIQEFTNQFNTAIKSYLEKENVKIDKIGAADSAINQIKLLQKEVEKLQASDETNGLKKLEQERELIGNMISIYKQALSNRENLTEEDAKKIEEALKNLTAKWSDLGLKIDDVISNAQQSIDSMVQTAVVGLTGMDAQVVSTMLLLNSKLKETGEAFEVLKKEGLDGIRDRLANGKGIGAMANILTLVISKVQELGAAIGDAFSVDEGLGGFEQFLFDTSQAMDGIVKTITSGLIDPEAIRKLFNDGKDPIAEFAKERAAALEKDRQTLEDTVKNFASNTMELAHLQNELDQAQAESISNNLKKQEALIAAKKRELELDLTNLEIQAIEQNKSDAWLDLQKRLRTKKFEDWKTDLIEKEEQKRTEVIQSGLDKIEDAYNQQRDDLLDRYDAESKAIDDNLKKIRERYKAEEDAIKRIDDLLNKSGEDQAQRQKISQTFANQTANLKQSLGSDFFLQSLTNEDKIDFGAMQSSIDDQFLMGNITSEEKAKQEKELNAKRFLYYQNLADNITNDRVKREEMLDQARQAREEYFQIEKEQLDSANEENRLIAEKKLHQEKMASISAEYDAEIENSRNLGGKYLGMMDTLDQNFASAVANFKRGLLDSAIAFGSELNSQLNKSLIDNGLAKGTAVSAPAGSSEGKYARGGIPQQYANDVDSYIAKIKAYDAAQQRTFHSGVANVPTTGNHRLLEDEMVLDPQAADNLANQFGGSREAALNYLSNPSQSGGGNQYFGGSRNYQAIINGSGLSTEQLSAAIQSAFAGMERDARYSIA